MKIINVPIFLLALICSFGFQGLISASSGDIEISSHGSVSEFPEGIRFSIEVYSEDVVEEIALRMRIGPSYSAGEFCGRHATPVAAFH